MYIGNIPHLILDYHKKSENGREISVARRFFLELQRMKKNHL